MCLMLYSLAIKLIASISSGTRGAKQLVVEIIVKILDGPISYIFFFIIYKFVVNPSYSYLNSMTIGMRFAV